MRLSSVSIKKLVKGACYFEEHNGYLFPYHYSEAQIEYFKDLDFWNSRSRFSAGIKLEFKTNATQINLAINTVVFGSGNSTIDLYINDVLHKIHYIESQGKSRVSFVLPDGVKTVSIYLPIDSEVGIKELSLNGNYKSVKDKTRVLIIGDSITQGYGAVWAGASYVNVLSRLAGYTILNQGIGGYRFDHGGVSKIEGFEPEKIIVALGTNYYDCQDTYDYERETALFFEKLKKEFPSTPVCVLTPLWRNNDVIWDRFIWCINTIKEICSNYENIKLIDGFELVPNLDECFVDKIHPNSYGMLLYATNLHKKLKEIKF